MRLPLSIVFAAAAVLVSADEECAADARSVSTAGTFLETSRAVVDSVPATIVSPDAVEVNSTSINSTALFAPILAPDVDVHAIKNVIPAKNVSLCYGTNDTALVPESTQMNITHEMKYPTVLLEDIASITNVDCSDTSVIMSFSNTTVFNATFSSWSAQDDFVLITNHLGDCDVELERGYFIVNSIDVDQAALTITAHSEKSDVSNTAAITEIVWGGINGNVPLNKRTTLEPSYTINTDITLVKDTVIFEYDPYVTVTADTAVVSAAVTFSGYLKYNWLLFKMEDLYFDIDTDFSADVGLSVDVAAAYSDNFEYAPDALSYSLISVPGILELGPSVKFGIGADISVDSVVDISTAVGIDLEGGAVHLDVLNGANTGTSGWTPTYTASVNVSGQVEADINPYVSLTVQLAVNFFSGLIDLSSGLTAKPGFNNTLILSGTADVDLEGVTGLNSTGGCSNGLFIDSDFYFSVDAFATQWFNTQLYAVTLPVFEKCWSWV